MCELQVFSTSCKESAFECLWLSGLIMRKVALQKIHQASKQAEQAADRYKLFQSHIMMKAPNRSLPNMGKKTALCWVTPSRDGSQQGLSYLRGSRL